MYFIATILIDGAIISLSNVEGIVAHGLTAISGLVSLFWYYHIIKRSRLRATKYYRWLQLSTAILLIGALGKLQHWWFASYLLTIGMVAFAFVYLLRFIAKSQKRLLDIVKLLFIELTLFVSLSKLEHYSVEPYEIIKFGLFYIMIFLFSIEVPRSKLNKGFFA